MRDPHHRRCLKNLRLERDNETLYRQLAELSDDPPQARAYRRIAEGEARNAAFWERCLREHGGAVPVHRPHLRTRLLGQLARWFGTGFVMPTVVRLDHADHTRTPVDRQGHRDHFPSSAPPRTRRFGRDGAGGNTLRASVLGANDGLVSNVSLVMGMAGAGAGHPAIALAGMAGLVAGACSMALGEWLSVNSSREFYQARITERAERLAVAPDEAHRRLAAIYRERGMDTAEADHLAGHFNSNPRAALEAMVREELGVDPDELGGSAWGAALSSFCLFAFGALFPVAPYLFMDTTGVVWASAASTLAGLCLIALGTALFTGRNLGFAIARQCLVTAAAAGLTWGVGKLLGIALLG